MSDCDHQIGDGHASGLLHASDLVGCQELADELSDWRSTRFTFCPLCGERLIPTPPTPPDESRRGTAAREQNPGDDTAKV